MHRCSIYDIQIYIYIYTHHFKHPINIDGLTHFSKLLLSQITTSRGVSHAQLCKSSFSKVLKFDTPLILRSIPPHFGNSYSLTGAHFPGHVFFFFVFWTRKNFVIMLESPGDRFEYSKWLATRWNPTYVVTKLQLQSWSSIFQLACSRIRNFTDLDTCGSNLKFDGGCWEKRLTQLVVAVTRLSETLKFAREDERKLPLNASYSSNTDPLWLTRSF